MGSEVLLGPQGVDLPGEGGRSSAGGHSASLHFLPSVTLTCESPPVRGPDTQGVIRGAEDQCRD